MRCREPGEDAPGLVQHTLARVKCCAANGQIPSFLLVFGTAGSEDYAQAKQGMQLLPKPVKVHAQALLCEMAWGRAASMLVKQAGYQGGLLHAGVSPRGGEAAHADIGSSRAVPGKQHGRCEAGDHGHLGQGEAQRLLHWHAPKHHSGTLPMAPALASFRGTLLHVAF